MEMYIFDIEVYKFDWLIVFKNVVTGEYTVIHNDNHAVKEFVTRDKLLGGFNNKHYDNYILKAIIAGADNTLVKEINDFIIAGNLGFEHWFIKQSRAWFNTFDIRDDMQEGLSLKAIEGHLGMNIEETEVPFDIDRPLTKEELVSTIHYCKHDVDATEKIVRLRKNYLKCKQRLGAMKGIPVEKSLYATNAKITAMYLGAIRREWNDGREYEYPENLDISAIPSEILGFFDTIHDTSLSDEEWYKTSLEIDIGGCPCKFAWGGVHGSLLKYHEKATEDRVIQNRDVTSLYPSLIIKYNYLSRNAESPEVFKITYDRRLEAKHSGDKETSNTLKLPLNIVSGATEQVFNDLYDPKQARGMRISGQLFLTELVMKLIRGCKTFKLLNFNTDGLMYSVDKVELPIVEGICEEWEESTDLELETDEIKEVWIKDVNNLLFVTTKDKVKTVGGYLNYGISEKGAWNINNNATIIKKALAEYLVKGIDPKDTIYASDDIFEFQFIAKAGSKYSRAYQIVYGTEMEIQKVNRVYATKNAELGKLYKVHRETGRPAKIDSLPEYCIIDNDNKLSIKDIDREYYINQTWEKIKDFIGEVNSVDEYVKLSDLEKVPGIGDKTMERIRESVEVFTTMEVSETKQHIESKKEKIAWLDDLLGE